MDVPAVTRSAFPMAGEALEVHADVVFGDALAESPCSPGECCDAAVLFAELAHPDSLAAGRSADEVAVILRGFFAAVADVTDAHGGYTDRGDLCAAVCVFGAPATSTHAADAALAGARELRERLAAELPGVEFSIGVSAGAAVPGWLPATRRFEPLTLCAPIAEATRLCELAGADGRSVLASERALVRASAAEAGRWSSAATATGLPAATPIATTRSTLGRG